MTRRTRQFNADSGRHAASMEFTEDLEVGRSRLVAGAGGRTSWTSVYSMDAALDKSRKFSNLTAANSVNL